jgi:argonaute-like protein implicated in RNA metabolism and viral defense
MSVTFTKESDDLFVINVQGIFTFDDLKEVEKSAREQIDRNQKVKLLVLAEDFTGWGKEGDWGDLTFMYEYDPYIEKIAVVAKANWKDQILMYLGAGRRQAEVKFFFYDQEKDARDWLQGESK